MNHVKLFGTSSFTATGAASPARNRTWVIINRRVRQWHSPLDLPNLKANPATTHHVNGRSTVLLYSIPTARRSFLCSFGSFRNEKLQYYWISRSIEIHCMASGWSVAGDLCAVCASGVTTEKGLVVSDKQPNSSESRWNDTTVFHRRHRVHPLSVPSQPSQLMVSVTVGNTIGNWTLRSSPHVTL